MAIREEAVLIIRQIQDCVCIKDMLTNGREAVILI